MSDDEIQSPLARKTGIIKDADLFTSPAEKIEHAPPIAPIARTARPDITVDDPAYANHKVIEGKGGMFGPITIIPQASDAANIAGLDAIVEYVEATGTPEPKKAAEPLPFQPPIILRINSSIVDRDVRDFYNLSDYESRNTPYEPRTANNRKYALAAAVLTAATAVTSIFGATYRPTGTGNGTAPATTRTQGTATDGRTSPDNHADTWNDGFDTWNDAPESDPRKEPATIDPRTPRAPEQAASSSTERPTGAISLNGFASYIGDYRFSTTWAGRTREYTIYGTLTEKGQAYNLLSRIAFEDRLADPNAKETYLGSELFQRCDPDGDRHITFFDVQRIAQRYANLRDK